jgi:hypothetical protein
MKWKLLLQKIPVSSRLKSYQPPASSNSLIPAAAQGNCPREYTRTKVAYGRHGIISSAVQIPSDPPDMSQHGIKRNDKRPVGFDACFCEDKQHRNMSVISLSASILPAVPTTKLILLVISCEQESNMKIIFF